MPDGSYQPKIYRKQGGATQVLKSGGDIEVQRGGKIWDDNAEQSSLASMVFYHDVLLPHSSGASALTVNLQVEDRLQIIDASVLKTGGGSSGTTLLTAQVQTSTGGAISDAMDMKKVIGSITRAGVLSPTLAIRAAGGVIRVVRAGSAGTSVAGGNIAATIRVTAVKRLA